MTSSNDNVMVQHMKQPRRVLGIVAAVIAGGTAIGGTIITLIVASPVLLFFSPILVPLTILAGLAFGGLVCTVLFGSSVAWVYKYVKGKQPIGSHQVDAVKNRIVHKAREVREFLRSKADA